MVFKVGDWPLHFQSPVRSTPIDLSRKESKAVGKALTPSLHQIPMLVPWDIWNNSYKQKYSYFTDEPNFFDQIDINNSNNYK